MLSRTVTVINMPNYLSLDDSFTSRRPQHALYISKCRAVLIPPLLFPATTADPRSIVPLPHRARVHALGWRDRPGSPGDRLHDHPRGGGDDGRRDTLR